MEEKREEFKRETAKIVEIRDILTAKYVKTDEFPNYFESAYGRFSRVNVVGFLVSKEPQRLMIDDSSGSIEIRSFDVIRQDGIEIGDNVNIIGKPREFNDKIYVIPEIVKKITDNNYLEYRKLILAARTRDPGFVEQKKQKSEPMLFQRDAPVQRFEEEPLSEEPLKPTKGKIDVPISAVEQEIVIMEEKISEQKPENEFSKIIDAINRLDDGDGVYIDRIISETKIEECERKIKRLLEKGDIFEIRPGKVKVL